MEKTQFWKLSESDTNPDFGCKPEERTLDQLLNSGVILVDKPRGPTSHQLTAWARDLLGISKIGHGGTLDPFATGLLTLLLGKATRLTDIVETRKYFGKTNQLRLLISQIIYDLVTFRI